MSTNNNMRRNMPEIDCDCEIERQRAYADFVFKKNKENHPDRKPGYYIQTLGCQQNEADSERLAGWAENMGYTKLDSPEEANLILVNTCAVREHAELRALSFIGQYKHVKDKDSSVIIGVCGCMVAQAHRAEKLKKSYPYVNFVFDTASLHRLPELVLNAMTGGKRSFIKTEKYEIVEGVPFVSASSHSALLSVMYGCNNFCSYCIVPYTRGRERSRRPDDIIEDAKKLVASGAKEIMLLGQNVNSYGKDLDCGADIAEIMHRICAIDGDFRVRFMTSHPKDASDELIHAIASEAKMIKHFHLPVQSGSDAILAKMNRKYTAEKYMKIIEKIKSADPDISITSDIIVGFPTESEADFQATLDLIEAVGYDMIFSFIYSPRMGTPAAKMDGQIPHEVSTERFERLLALGNSLSLQRNKRFVGRDVRIVVDEVSRTDSEFLTGRGDPVRPIHFRGDKSLIGKFVNCKITQADTFSFNAELCE